MYKVTLTESYFPAQHDAEILETTVGGVLRMQAARTPGAEALVECDMAGRLGRRWTYAELLADSERLATALLSRYQPGERICVWAPNTPEWVILEYAAALSGLTLVTANPGYQPRELRFVLEQSRSKGLFMVREYRGNPMAEIAAKVAADLPALREVIDMDNAAALYAGAHPATKLPDVKPGDAAQVQYTSGTTGFPKGAVLHHRGITNNSRHVMERLSARHGATLLNFMPMFHTSGCVGAALGAVQTGARMIQAKVFDPSKMLDIIESERVERLVGVPTMLTALCDVQAAKPRDVSCVVNVGSGGSMVAPELVRRVVDLFGCTFNTVYGQTETSPLLTTTLLDDDFDDTCNTIGQAMPLVELSIRDPQTNKVVPIGDIGEICARGYNLMIGYNDNPEANAQTFDAEGWLHTGDLGTMDARGYLKITGRVKEMIIRGGENLFPAEIENVLLEHPDVAEVAVVGIPDPRWGEVVACFARMRAGVPLDKAALVAHCRAHIAAQKTPTHWVEMTDWPLTGSGKIQKFVLRDRFVAGDLAPA